MLLQVYKHTLHCDSAAFQNKIELIDDAMSTILFLIHQQHIFLSYQLVYCDCL